MRIGLPATSFKRPALAGLHAGLVNAVPEHVVVVPHDIAHAIAVLRWRHDSRWLPSISSLMRVCISLARPIVPAGPSPEPVVGHGQKRTAQRIEVDDGRSGGMGRGFFARLFSRRSRLPGQAICSAASAWSGSVRSACHVGKYSATGSRWVPSRSRTKPFTISSCGISVTVSFTS